MRRDFRVLLLVQREGLPHHMGLPRGGPLCEHCWESALQRGGQRGTGAIRGLLDRQGPDVGGVEGSAELVEAPGVLDGAGDRRDRLGLSTAVDTPSERERERETDRQRQRQRQRQRDRDRDRQTDRKRQTERDRDGDGDIDRDGDGAPLQIS